MAPVTGMRMDSKSIAVSVWPVTVTVARSPSFRAAGASAKVFFFFASLLLDIKFHFQT